MQPQHRTAELRRLPVNNPASVRKQLGQCFPGMHQERCRELSGYQCVGGAFPKEPEVVRTLSYNAAVVGP
jgi:hypothetical protein